MVTRDSQAGFTMIEVMVAMLLTAIAIIGILGLFMAQTKASSFSRHSTEATALCEDKLEKLRTLTAASPGINGTETTLDEKGVIGAGIYTRTWSYTAQVNYVDIVCTASWTEDEGAGAGSGKAVTLRDRRKP
jgi:prepilin-type N-terminal cleavage/methylation domain-containing protein